MKTLALKVAAALAVCFVVCFCIFLPNISISHPAGPMAISEEYVEPTATPFVPRAYPVDVAITPVPVEENDQLSRVEPEENEQLSREEEPVVDYDDVAYIAKTIYGEALGVSYTEKCLVAWCILNRVDDPRFPDSVAGVVTQSGQFYGYSEYYPAEGECWDAALDVYTRWLAEKSGEDVGRELGSAYIYFHGDGYHNYYRTEY